MRTTNLVLEAGAGTGKTTAIVAEALAVLVRHREIDPGRLALITFTEKAAGEIAERIRSAIVDMMAEGSDGSWPPGSTTPLFELDPGNEEERATLAERCEQLDRIRSQTIHSFCQSILRSHPIAAGVDAQFGIIQGFEQEVLYDRIYTQWLEREVERGDETQKEEWKRALDWHMSFLEIRKQVFSQLKRRDLLFDKSLTLESSPQAFGDVRDNLMRIAEDPKKNFDDLRALLLKDPPPAGHELRVWIEWARRNRETIASIKAPSGRAADITPVRELFADERTVFEQEEITLIMRDLARRFFEHLDREKQRLGVVDFDDLLLRTRDLLRDHGRIRANVRSRYDLIVVDEFQDTDPVQTEIVRLLTTDDAGNSIPGKLIVVGDPKQSIYSFRRADPENYGRTINRLVEESAERRELVDQFRSDPQLVDQLNPLMSRLFSIPRQAGVFQPAYQPLVARASNSWNDEVRIDLLLLPPTEASGLPKRNAQTRARDESRAMTAWLLDDQNARGCEWSEYALLFPKMTHVERFFDAFESAGIPFILGGGRSLLEERSAAELLAVLRTIATPIDLAAEISAARSPFFGLTDDELTLKRRSGANESYENFEHQIRKYRELASQLPIHRLIDRILDDSEYETTQSLLKTPERALSAVHRLRDLAAEFDTRVSGSLSEFVDEMLRRKKAEAEITTQSEDPGSANAVRLMTVHASKGLEFGTVILPAFNARGRWERRLIAVREANRLVVSGKPLTVSSAIETLDGRILKAIAAERDDAEQDRLFYVAVTRAIHRIVVIGDSDSKVEGFWKQWGKLFERTPASYASANFENGPFVEQTIVEGREIRVRISQARFDPSSTTRSRIRDSQVAAVVDERPLSGSVTYPEIVVQKPPVGDAIRARARGKHRLAGILLHRFLELWDLQEASVRQLLSRCATELGAKPMHSVKVEKRITAILRSPDFSRIQSHRIVGREVPIIIEDERGRAAERRIDLLLHDGERLRILDYKSGRADLFRIQADRRQVEEYCRTVERMSGEPCDGLLWYVDLEEAQLIDARVAV